MTLTDINLLYEFHFWATGRMLASVDALPEEALHQEIKSSYNSLHATLVHMVGAEYVWWQRFVGDINQKFQTVQDLPTYADVKRLWKQTETDLLAYIIGLSEDKLAEEFSFKNIKGEFVTQRRWQALQHVVNHAAYHRGQVTTMIRQLGGTPTATDLIMFYRQKNKQGKAPP